MLSRQLSQASAWRRGSICLFCAARSHLSTPQLRPFATTTSKLVTARRARKRIQKIKEQEAADPLAQIEAELKSEDAQEAVEDPTVGGDAAETKKTKFTKAKKSATKDSDGKKKTTRVKKSVSKTKSTNADIFRRVSAPTKAKDAVESAPMSLKEALLAAEHGKSREPLDISVMFPDNLEFTPVEVDKPPVPMLSYGLDRVLFNSGVYRLQDPRSRVYNFDPYLEKIMPVSEFDFDALSEYKTSSKDEELLRITQNTGAKFTGSTSSMSGILQHFHYILSNFRGLNHEMLSRDFPKPSDKFSRITLGPSAVFLRYKNGVYAIDADKSYDRPNIMSWLGHSLEKLLTTERTEFERFRKSNPDKAPAEDKSSRCYHYSRQGNLLMRSQLDAYDPRLPGTGVFDLKTRAVVSIRMNHRKYEEGVGYQLRHALGQWESFEREFYDMTRATLLKYSLQVRMGRMDGIFIAFHNIERIFGFQYLSLADMDEVLHGQRNTYLGDQEFKLSIALLDEILSKATAQFPHTSLRLHVEAREAKTPFMYIFAEPVTDEKADEIQNVGDAAQKEFARNVVGVGKLDPKVQAEWQKTQDEVDEQVVEDQHGAAIMEEAIVETENEAEQEGAEQTDEEVAAESDTGEGDEVEVEVEAQAEIEDEIETEVDAEIAESPRAEEQETLSGPLMGWTLTVRSKVNHDYVDRPVKLDSHDEWNIEYNLQEISEDRRWAIYNGVKERRRLLIGQDEEEADKGLKTYRDLIQRYSDRGREWRKKQDEINEELGVRLYRPLGPGSGSGEYVDGQWVLGDAAAAELSVEGSIAKETGTVEMESGKESAVDTNAGEFKAADSMSEEAKKEVLEDMPSVPS